MLDPALALYEVTLPVFGPVRFVAAYQPGKVMLSVHMIPVPLPTRESKFCEYVPPLINTWAETAVAKRMDDRPAGQIKKFIFTL